MLLYTPGPYYGIPPPPGYTSTGVAVSGGPQGIGASEIAGPLKGPIMGLILGSFPPWRKCSIATGSNLPSSLKSLRSLPRQCLKSAWACQFPHRGMPSWVGTGWSEIGAAPNGDHLACSVVDTREGCSVLPWTPVRVRGHIPQNVLLRPDEM